ncbi:MAG: hypothetical protein WBP89_14775, partial [Sedimenticolaceae bacterium]
VWLIPDPNTILLTTAETLTAAVAIDPVDGRAGHLAAADASASGVTYPILGSGGLLRSSTTIARFDIANRTYTEALGNGPLWAQALAQTRVDLRGVVAVPLLEGASLDLSWDVNHLGIRTRPSSSFALTQHVALVTQAPILGDALPAVTRAVGFVALSQDGNTMVQALDLPGSTAIKDWLAAVALEVGNLPARSAAAEGAVIPLNLQSPGLPDGPRVEIPLNLAFTDPATGLPLVDLSIQISHTEYAAEAPLTAASRVAEQAGSVHSGSRLYWDAASRNLTFDRLPLDVLSLDARSHVGPSFLDDRLAGGFLEIDPFRYVTTFDDDGYFVGDEVRLVDRNGDVVFRAPVPGAVFDDRLVEEEGFNLFAPLLNTGETGDTGSEWLDRFDDRLRDDDLFLPELFIGFDPPDSDDDWWEEDFEAIADAVVSFAGPLVAGEDLAPISAPPVGLSLFLGFAVLMAVRRRSNALATSAVGGHPYTFERDNLDNAEVGSKDRN